MLYKHTYIDTSLTEIHICKNMGIFHSLHQWKAGIGSFSHVAWTLPSGQYVQEIVLPGISACCCHDKKTNLRKERFIWAHGFRAGLSGSIALRSEVRNKSWQRGVGAKRRYSPNVSQDRQEGTKAIYRLQRHTPGNLRNGATHMQGGSSLFCSSYPEMALFYLN